MIKIKTKSTILLVAIFFLNHRLSSFHLFPALKELLPIEISENAGSFKGARSEALGWGGGEAGGGRAVCFMSGVTNK